MMRFYLEAVGLCGPGLAGWSASLPVLAGTQAYVPAPAMVPPSVLLPANERRRAALIVKIALAVGAEAFAAAGREPAETATVFASSGGDGETIHTILSTLASPNRELSPTRFHNSVHNASAGYWSIATRSQAASTCLCCHDDSFAAGLLEAAVQVAAGQQPVALIAYDVPYPWPLSAVRPIGDAFGVALLLAPERSAAALACVELALLPRCGAPSSLTPDLEALRLSVPAARSLPLLAALAHAAQSNVILDYLDDLTLTLKIAPIGQKVRSLHESH
jgi:Beta-ketoacyl synthase, N-terminal domain